MAIPIAILKTKGEKELAKVKAPKTKDGATAAPAA